MFLMNFNEKTQHRFYQAVPRIRAWHSADQLRKKNLFSADIFRGISVV